MVFLIHGVTEDLRQIFWPLCLFFLSSRQFSRGQSASDASESYLLSLPLAAYHPYSPWHVGEVEAQLSTALLTPAC